MNCFKMELVGTTLGCTLELTGLQEIELKQEEAKFISQYLIVIQGQKKRGLPSKNTAHSHLSQNLACLCALPLLFVEQDQKHSLGVCGSLRERFFQCGVAVFQSAIFLCTVFISNCL